MSYKSILEVWINEVYENKDNIIIDHKLLNDVVDSNALNTFHMKEACVVEKNDDSFCGIRADHFLIEFGYCEEGTDSIEQPVILITANHKGYRCITMLKISN